MVKGHLVKETYSVEGGKHSVASIWVFKHGPRKGFGREKPAELEVLDKDVELTPIEQERLALVQMLELGEYLSGAGINGMFTWKVIADEGRRVK